MIAGILFGFLPLDALPPRERLLRVRGDECGESRQLMFAPVQHEQRHTGLFEDRRRLLDGVIANRRRRTKGPQVDIADEGEGALRSLPDDLL